MPLKRLADEPQAGELARKVVGRGLPFHDSAQGADDMPQRFMFDGGLVQRVGLRHGDSNGRDCILPRLYVLYAALALTVHPPRRSAAGQQPSKAAENPVASLAKSR